MRELERAALAKLVFICVQHRAEKYLGNPVKDAECLYKLIKMKPLSKTTVRKVLTSSAGRTLTRDNLRLIADNANGDLTSALNSLALETSVDQKGKSVKVETSTKDFKWSIFHALGKVLYNKRIVEGKPERLRYLDRTNRPPSYINPEKIIFEIGGELFLFNAMLLENYPDFFDDCE
jgi:DNA polymerase III delta prime subunit